MERVQKIGYKDRDFHSCSRNSYKNHCPRAAIMKQTCEHHGAGLISGVSKGHVTANRVKRLKFGMIVVNEYINHLRKRHTLRL